MRGRVRRWSLAVLSTVLVSCGGGGGSSDGDSPQDQTYFPLGANDLWSYQTEPGTSLTTTRVTGTQTVGGQTGVVVQSINSANNTPSLSVYLRSRDGVWESPPTDAGAFSQAIGTVQLLRLPVTIGDSFVQVDKVLDSGVDFDGDGRTDRVAVRSVVTVMGLDSVATPAGTFEGSLHQRTEVTYTFTFTSSGGTATVQVTSDDWYAPDVGPVRSVVTTRNGPYTDTTTQSLAAYRVGSRKSETVAPTVQSVTPASTPVRASGMVVGAVFSEAMDVASLNAGGFSVIDAGGRPVPGTVTMMTANTARFDPAQAWASGSYTVTIGAAAQDLVGNAFVGERVWHFDLDATAPAVVSTLPPEGGTDVALTSPIVLQFSEPLDPASVNASSVSLTDLGTPIQVSFAVVGSTVTITPQTALPRGRALQVQVSPAVTDTLGNPLDQYFTLSFRSDPGRFALPSALAPTVTTEAMAIGDVNGDGINDVVLTSSVASDPSDQFGLFVLAGRADGTLSPPMRIGTGSLLGCWLTSVAIGDVDGDGRNDVVVGGNGCGAQVFHQAADGSLVASQFLNRAATATLRIADLDGDGRADLVGVSGGSDIVNVWHQNAAGQLVLQATPSLGVTGAHDIEIGDVNSDGRPDLVVTINGGFPGQNVAVLRQQADGSFKAPIFLAADPTWGAFGVAIGDLNGDGRNDVVVTTGGNSPTSIGVYYQGIDGTLGAMTQIATYDSPMAVRVVDINNDGRADIVVSHQGWLSVGIYFQQADGSLAAEDRFPAPYGNYNAQSMAVGDVNRDGRPDIVIAGELLLQRPLPAPTSAPPGRARALTLAPLMHVDKTMRFGR